MQQPALLAATGDTAHSHSLLDALPHLAGMLVVLITLAFLWGICALTATIIKLLMRPPQVAAPPAPAVSATAPATALSSAPLTPAPPEDPATPPEVVAVIAAAVATVCGGKPVRLISIKPVSTSWERAGRQSVLTSHRIR